MQLVVGGAASGKRSYAHSIGFVDEQIAQAAIDARPVVADVQELVSARLADYESRHPEADINQLMDDLFQELIAPLKAKELVLCDEQGAGVIPLEPHDRRVREISGRLCSELAQHATKVVRMVCGIPQVLKDDSRLITVHLLRHGKTSGNRRRAYLGRGTDEPLDEAGAAELSALGCDPAVNLAFVTPLQRTSQTARLFYPNAQLTVIDELAEMDFGAFEGRSADEMADNAEYRAWVEGGCNGVCPGGESREGFTRRSCLAFDKIVHESDRANLRQVIIVGHGGTLMSILGTYGRPHKPYWEWRAGNGCGYRFVVDPLTWDANPVAVDIQPMRGPHLQH